VPSRFARNALSWATLIDARERRSRGAASPAQRHCRAGPPAVIEVRW